MHPHITRLNEAITAVCPHYGATPNSFSGTPTEVHIDYRSEATAEQRTAAQAVVAEFDWSEEAHTTWLANRNPEKRDLAAAAAQAITRLDEDRSDLQTFAEATGGLTAAQLTTALRAMAARHARHCAFMSAIVKRLVQVE